jgi:hypothetical protein
MASSSLFFMPKYASLLLISRVSQTGELQERRLQHREEAEKFYRNLAAQE